MAYSSSQTALRAAYHLASHTTFPLRPGLSALTSEPALFSISSNIHISHVITYVNLLNSYGLNIVRTQSHYWQVKTVDVRYLILDTAVAA